MKTLIEKLRKVLINDKTRLSRFDKYVLKYKEYDDFKKKFLGLRNSKHVRSIFEKYETENNINESLNIESNSKYMTEKELIEKNNLKLQNVWDKLNIVKPFLDNNGYILSNISSISISEAAKYFKVSEDTIIKWDKDAKTNAIENDVINTSKFKYILKREFENKIKEVVYYYKHK